MRITKMPALNDYRGGQSFLVEFTREELAEMASTEKKFTEGVGRTVSDLSMKIAEAAHEATKNRE